MKKNVKRFEADIVVHPDEEKIVDTVNKSIEIFYIERTGKAINLPRIFVDINSVYTQKKLVVLTNFAFSRNLG